VHSAMPHSPTSNYLLTRHVRFLRTFERLNSDPWSDLAEARLCNIFENELPIRDAQNIERHLCQTVALVPEHALPVPPSQRIQQPRFSITVVLYDWVTYVKTCKYTLRTK
jgi:hypothetical protein